MPIVDISVRQCECGSSINLHEEVAEPARVADPCNLLGLQPTLL